MTTNTRHQKPAVYTTKHVATALGVSTQTLRRHLRKLGRRAGTGARHAWSADEFGRVVKQVRASMSEGGARGADGHPLETDARGGSEDGARGALTHFDAQGRARMVDVASKSATHRIAVARGAIRMQADTLRLIVSGGHRKGDVIGVARLAGIMAAKRTSDLVPLCHPLALTRVEVELWPDESRPGVECRTRVETVGPTGVEMEALTATQVALLTVYDMCKAVDRMMTIESVRLVEKRGGRSGDWVRSGS